MASLARYVLGGLRGALRRAGIDVVRHPPRGPLHPFLRHFGIGTIIDVGANAGQYGQWLRRVQGYSGEIVSFEPNPKPFRELQELARADGHWQCFNVGLGAEQGTLPLHVAEEDVFSSMLRANDRLAQMHRTAIAEQYIDVPVWTLGYAFDAGAFDFSRGNVLLKIDTQGFERPVLEGARVLLDRIAGLQLELSFEPLYDGQPVIEEVIGELRAMGFVPYGFWTGYMDRDTGALLEVDGLFARA